MKSIKNTIISTSLILLVSCSEQELIKEPTEGVSLEQIKRATDINKGTQDSNIAGLYTLMLKTGTGGTTGADDFGQKGYDIKSDMLSGDMVLAATVYGWYSDLSNLQITTDFTDIENYRVWRYYYRIVFASNGIIDALGGNDATDLDDVGKQYMGQAKAMRAYAYFYLINFLSEDFNLDEKVLPLYLSTEKSNLAQSTTKEIFDQIIKDLEESIILLDGFTRPSKSYVDKYIAEGLLAYTYASMGNYDKVKDLSNDILENGGYTIVTKDEAIGGFNNFNTSGWMWGADLTTQTGLNLISWWGQVDIYTYSYATADYKPIDKSLYDQIKSDDIRKQQFLNITNGNITYTLVGAGKFYDPDKKIDGQRIITTDYLYMRVAEFQLLYAESLAKTGDEGGAKAALKVLLSNRFDNASSYAYVDGLSGQDLLDEIYLQTRIELWGEGKSYLAMKRNKATIVRGSNHLSFVGEPIPYNDPRLTYTIPQSEVINNPNIKKN